MKTTHFFFQTLLNVAFCLLTLSPLSSFAQNSKIDSSKIYLPEAMTINMDSLLNEWKAQNYIYPDTTCAQPNINSTFDTAVYIKGYHAFLL